MIDANPCLSDCSIDSKGFQQLFWHTGMMNRVRQKMTLIKKRHGVNPIDSTVKVFCLFRYLRSQDCGCSFQKW
jgi:hypothetical protein